MLQGYIETNEIEKVEIEPLQLDRSMIPAEHQTRFFNPGELEKLAALIKMQYEKTGELLHVVEFGCQNGRTARVLLENLPFIARYTGIDVPPTYVTECKVQQSEIPERPGEFALNDERFTLLLNKKGTRGVRREALRYADVVFIDGDHSYDGVIHDDGMAVSIAMHGTLIIHHDYHNLGTVGVKKALLALQAQNKKFKHIKNTWLCYREAF